MVQIAPPTTQAPPTDACYYAAFLYYEAAYAASHYSNTPQQQTSVGGPWGAGDEAEGTEAGRYYFSREGGPWPDRSLNI